MGFLHRSFSSDLTEGQAVSEGILRGEPGAKPTPTPHCISLLGAGAGVTFPWTAWGTQACSTFPKTSPWIRECILPSETSVRKLSFLFCLKALQVNDLIVLELVMQKHDYYLLEGQRPGFTRSLDL